MQKQDRNENLLGSNARNQRQQIESRRDIEDHSVRNEIENNYSIKNLGHLFLLHVTSGVTLVYQKKDRPVDRRAQWHSGTSIGVNPSASIGCSASSSFIWMSVC